MENRYLITIYVTDEQEHAINYLYQLKGWTFLKLGKPSLFNTPPELLVNSSAEITYKPNKQSLPDTEEHDSESTDSVTSGDVKLGCPNDSDTEETQTQLKVSEQRLAKKPTTRRKSARKRKGTVKRSKIKKPSDDSDCRSPVISRVGDLCNLAVQANSVDNNNDVLSRYNEVKSEKDTEILSSGKLQKDASKKQITEPFDDEMTCSASSGTEYCSSNEDKDANTIAVKGPQQGMCIVCGVATTDKAMQDLHQQMDCSNILQVAKTTEGYFCSTCNVTISASNTFINHLLNGSCGSQSCRECGLFFTTFVLYEQHQNMLCSEKLQANEIDTGYHCKACRSTFKESSTFIKHKLLKSCIGDVLKCEFCGKTYPKRRRDTFSLHLRNHLDDRPHVCNVCGKRYLRSVTLRDHMRQHTGERPFSCNYCHMVFTTGCHRNNHEKLNHLEIPRSHVCHMCGKAFKFRARLTAHLATVHVEERNFPCTFCDAKCKTNSMLKEHLKIHINPKDHMCDVCGRGFITQKYLNRHKRCHTEAKKHVCDGCGKAFVKKQYLIIHERTHSGVKPYLCTLCEYRCSSSGNMCKHIKTVHKMENPASYTKRIAA